MTFQEYLNQENPKKAVCVYITNDDTIHISVLNTRQCRAVITLEISGKCYSYHLSEQDNLLRTMDEDGNAKSVSCFIWQGSIPR